MSERISLPLFNPQQAHQGITHAWTDCIKPMLMAGHRLMLEVKKETRSSAQNRRLWAMLTDVSQQVDWHGRKLTAEELVDLANDASVALTDIPSQYRGAVAKIRA